MGGWRDDVQDEYVKPAGVDPSVPSAARMYDYWLGGKDNFAADRELGEKIASTMPGSTQSVLANRAFLNRAVRFVADAGVRQFIDIGSGLPTVDNTHEVAQRVSPEARVVYVDNDPIVSAHGRALLASTAATTVAQADLREPEMITGHPDVRDLIDFAEPFAVLVLGVLHFIGDHDDPYGIVARLRDAMAPGSYLIFSHLTGDDDPQQMAEANDLVRRAPTPVMSHPRSRAEAERFFDGFDLVDPGIVPVDQWRPEDPPAERFWLWAGVGQKPS